LNKCFENICGLILIESGGPMPDIQGMISGEREEVEFIQRIKLGRVGQGVEWWMGQIETSMQGILTRKVKEGHIAYYDNKVQRKDWVLNHIGQTIATVA
jgi:Dynein heavy chain, N-terminal region 2